MKGKFSSKVTHSIDWESLETAMNGLPLAQWLGSQTSSQVSPKWENMHCLGLWSKAQCPQCTCPMEDNKHIFKCPSKLVTKQWTKVMEELDQWLQTAKTHPQLWKDIVEGLPQWHDQTLRCRPKTEGSMAGQIQDCIGWGLALEGCLAKRWQEEQELFWKAFKIPEIKSTMDNCTADLPNDDSMGYVEPQKQGTTWGGDQQAGHSGSEVNQLIHQAYKQWPDQLPTNTRSLLKWPLSRLLKFPEQYKHQWLASMEVARAWLICLSQNPAQTEWRSMTWYFQRLANL